MESLEYQQELKKKFFDKKLSTEEWVVFTRLMSSNKDFAEDIAFEIELRETLAEINSVDSEKEHEDVDFSTKLSQKSWKPYLLIIPVILAFGVIIGLIFKNRDNENIEKKPSIVIPDTPSVLQPVIPKDSIKKDIPIVIKEKKQSNIPILKKNEATKNDSLKFAQWIVKNRDSWETAGINEFYTLMREARYDEALEAGIQYLTADKNRNNPKMAYIIAVISLFKKNDVTQAITFFEIANKDATYKDIAKEYYELALDRQKK